MCLYWSSTSAQLQLGACGQIGNDDETPATRLEAEMFYLNTANPAPCTGNISSWRVCYYGPGGVNDIGSYWATYAVYRRTVTLSPGDRVRYRRVSGVFTAVRTVEDFINSPEVDGEIEEDDFICYDDFLGSADPPLTIQAGDVVGACVFNPQNDFSRIPLFPFNIPRVDRLPLYTVGEVSGDGNELLLQMDTSRCTREDIPSDIPESQLSPIASRRLHIHANIGKSLWR